MHVARKLKNSNSGFPTFSKIFAKFRHYSSRDAGPRSVRTERTSDQRSLAGNGPGRQTTDQTMGKSGENRRRAKIRERMAEAAKSASPARETPRGAPTLPFTQLGGLRRPRVPHRNSPATVLQLQNAMTPPPRPTPHRVLNNAHYRDIESLFKPRRGAAGCPDRKDE